VAVFSKLFKRWLRTPPGQALVDDAVGGARWAAKALNDMGYKADFSLQSLRELDRFFDAQLLDGKAPARVFLSKHLGQRLFCLGAYCGEVIRRHAGGAWQAGEPGPQAEIDLAVVLPDGTLFWPVQRVMKRFQLGRDEGLFAYAQALVSSDETPPSGDFAEPAHAAALDPQAGAPVSSLLGQRGIGALMLIGSLAVLMYTWGYAPAHERIFLLWLLAPPALAVIGLGLLLFPIDVSALQRQHGVDRIQKWAHLPLAWRALMLLALVAALGNRYGLAGRLV
jgi:hypothetical protein